MIKKLLFLIITSLISFNFSGAQIVPLKKPSLSSEELNKKIILNTIKPLKKPSKVKVEKKVAKKETKLSFLLPKKNQLLED